MKRITVGRGNDCDIVIIDETDNVSRHHLVITFNFFGKMKVSDTSSNGTFINGTRMLKGVSIPVTTKDKIRLGRNIELDWEIVKDPYQTNRIATITFLTVLIVALLGIWGYMWYKETHKATSDVGIEIIKTVQEDDDSWNKDSTAKVAPTITSIDVKDKKKSTTEKSNRKKKNEKKVSIDKKKEIYIQKDDSELDSVAVF